MYLFYVYAYLRKDGTPYYIGKGSGIRFKEKHSVAIPSDKSRIVFLETHLSELGAFALERRMIRWYGRKDMGTGILRNRTDGGEGGSGVVHSVETRKKLSDANTGVPKPPRTAEHIANLVESRKGYKHSAETKAKMSAAKKGMVATYVHKPRTEEWKGHHR